MATYITLLLDKSGSMNDCKQKTIDAYNEYVNGLNSQVTLEDIFFSLIQFCTNGVQVVHRAIPLKDVPKLNGDTYRPEQGGGTPLIDATVKAINATAEKAPAGSRVQIVVQTDGYENASTQHKNVDLYELVKKKTAEGWLFTYLSAGIDSFAQASAMGFDRGATMNYSKNMSANAFKGAVRMSATYASTGNIGASHFTSQERLDSVDPNDQSLWSLTNPPTSIGGLGPKITETNPAATPACDDISLSSSDDCSSTD